VRQSHEHYTRDAQDTRSYTVKKILGRVSFPGHNTRIPSQFTPELPSLLTRH